MPLYTQMNQQVSIFGDQLQRFCDYSHVLDVGVHCREAKPTLTRDAKEYVFFSNEELKN